MPALLPWPAPGVSIAVRGLALATAALLAVACDAPGHPDGGVIDAGSAPDAAPIDDASVDASWDALPIDAGPPDTCRSDADCSNGRFCDGIERCGHFGFDHRTCGSDLPPCTHCDEAADRCCVDADHDGYAAIGCGYGDDCDDGSSSVHPYAYDECGGGDDDCNPMTFGSSGDLDGDGHARADCCQTLGDGRTECGDDCDDAVREIHPGSVERCDLRDQDCDAAIDEGLALVERIFAADCDHDGYGNPARGTVSCSPDAEPALPCAGGTWGYEVGLDCDDDDPEVHPDFMEHTCDGRDDDCDGTIDRTAQDYDGDGFPTFACDGTTDCIEGAATVYPGAPELCNGIDDDCDGTSDDLDGDGHIALDDACTGGPLPRDDCDDARSESRPGAFERCNGHDDDCDGVIDGTGAYCFGTHAHTTECRDAMCFDLTCQTGWGACVDPTRCVDDIATDETRCGSCTGRCASSMCVAGACTAFDALVLTDAQTLGRVGSDAVTFAPGGALRAGDRHWVGARAIGGGVRACYAWLDGSVTCPGAPAVAMVSIPDVAELATADAFTCARSVGGQVRCWGRGASGELGDGLPHTGLAGPVVVAMLSDARALAVAARSACALRANGRIQCWGSGHFGTLGDGTTRDAPAPVEVALATDAIAIAAGDWHVCAIDASGAVWCWGSNARGQRGVPGSANASTPERVPGIAGATSITAAGESTCAVVSGELACWGANESGQLGDGTRIDRAAPTPIATGISHAVLGRSHGCSIASSGAISCWGENDDGRLGDGTRVDALRPTPLDWAP